MHGCGGEWVKIHPVIRDYYTRMNGEPVMLRTGEPEIGRFSAAFRDRSNQVEG